MFFSKSPKPEDDKLKKEKMTTQELKSKIKILTKTELTNYRDTIVQQLDAVYESGYEDPHAMQQQLAEQLELVTNEIKQRILDGNYDINPSPAPNPAISVQPAAAGFSILGISIKKILIVIAIGFVIYKLIRK
jgi:hypothetical protein